MQAKKILERLLPAIGIAGILLVLITFFLMTFYLPGHTYTYYCAKQSLDAFGLPSRLKIPKIKIDAKVEHMGLTPDGVMDVPDGPVDVAWFNLGPRPGDVGSAVIAGHYGTWENGEGSVFDNLNKLKPGDKIYVEDEKGMGITFLVNKVVIYGQNDNASTIFRSSDGKAHLNLITCEGDWNKDQKTYSGRLVVFSDASY
jgi:LPXTG-site transpeptidase (sortase) family protein